MPPEEYAIMRECHSWHIEDRANHHISWSKVIDIMNQQPANKLNKMIRRYLNEERLKAVEDQEPSFENKLLGRPATQTEQ